MLSKFEQVKKEWGGHNDLIDQWLLMRQQLLIDYCKLAGLPPHDTAKRALPTTEQLKLFCDHLVDYISEGHFRIYDTVMDKWQATGYSPTDEISAVYANIAATTDPLLNFNDKYSDLSAEEELESFDSDISQVGELIELRFEQEDNLIELISESL